MQWFSYWKLSIRPDKCQAMNLSRRLEDCEFDFSIDGGIIEWCEEIKFLCFYVTRRGGFRKHAEYLRMKIFSRVNILKSLAQKKYGYWSYHLLTLASSSIRSVWSTGVAILNSSCLSLLQKLVVLQTRAIKVAL